MSQEKSRVREWDIMYKIFRSISKPSDCRPIYWLEVWITNSDSIKDDARSNWAYWNVCILVITQINWK